MKKLNKNSIFGIVAVMVLVAIAIFLYQFSASQEQAEPDFSSESSAVFLPDIDPLRDWYAHRMSDRTIILTRQEELPDIGATEGYAYGEQIMISVVPINV